MIWLPEFVTRQAFDWAVAQAEQKKMDFSQVEYFTYDEGECVQCMHIDPYDEKPATIAKMEAHAQEQGDAVDITDVRRHHEIYFSDARRCDLTKCRTVIRHPVKRVTNLQA